MRKYWLLKSEPSAWSWENQVKEGASMWDGVRNYQARNNLKEMMGDNAAMIAWACMKFYKKDRNDLFFKPMPRLEVRSVL